jgi:hypothetical protein
MAGRDLLALAQACLWLGQAECQAGRVAAVPELHDRIVRSLEAFKTHLLIGTPPRQQSQQIVQLEAGASLMLALARARTAAERIAVQHQEVLTRKEWADEQPDNPTLRFETAWSLVHLAQLQGEDGRAVEARSSLDHALPALQGLAKAEPENLRGRQGLAHAWETLSRVHARSGHRSEARDAVAKAVKIIEDLAQRDPVYCYDLACTLNLRGSLSSSDADAVAAIAALRQAIKNGFDNAHLLKTDPRLEGLRSRHDFPVLPEQAK